MSEHGPALARMTITVYAEYVDNHLDENPGKLTYKELATELKVCATHLERLDQNKRYQSEKSIEHINVEEI